MGRFARHYHLCTPSQGVTPPRGCLAWGKAYQLSKKLQEARIFTEAVDVFSKRTATVEEVVSAGERAIVSLYNGNPTDTLDELRFRKFSERVALSTGFLHVHTLPPTACEHSFKSSNGSTVTATWIRMTGDGVYATTASSLAWPTCHLHQMHFFKSSDATAGQTVTLGGAAAKKHGLACSTACGTCRGVTCANSPVISLEDVTEKY